MYRLFPRDTGYLFSSRDLREVFESQRAAMQGEVGSLDANRLLNTAPADLAAYLIDKYQIHAPTLHLDKWSVQENECQVDVSGDPNRFFHVVERRSGPYYIPGQCVQVEVPFEGDSEMFYCRPSTFSVNPPRGEIRDSTLVLTWEMPHDAARNLRPEIDRVVQEISQHVERIRTEVASFNSTLPNDAGRVIETRRARILANQGRVVSLGIPVKERSDSPKTYAVSTVRRKAAPVLPPATTAAYEPEPAWEMNHYEHALQVMQNVAIMIERSPSAFSKMEEEHLRDHFLVQLNGHFEGSATGETFNVSGKTDILLREKGRNVFIAECKFWRGPKAFGAAIDQLLDYAAWRDTKTAILVFCRDVEMSTVFAGVKSVSEAHENYKRTVDWKHESGFRFILHHRNDKNREFVLTVLAFHVPS